MFRSLLYNSPTDAKSHDVRASVRPITAPNDECEGFPGTYPILWSLILIFDLTQTTFYPLALDYGCRVHMHLCASGG